MKRHVVSANITGLREVSFSCFIPLSSVCPLVYKHYVFLTFRLRYVAFTTCTRIESNEGFVKSKKKICIPCIQVDCTCTAFLENSRRWLNVGLMLNHRLRRWPNNNPTLGQRLCLLGYGHQL